MEYPFWKAQQKWENSQVGYTAPFGQGFTEPNWWYNYNVYTPPGGHCRYWSSLKFSLTGKEFVNSLLGSYGVKS